MEKFKDLGLREDILTAIEKKGFTEPSPVQAQVIPILLDQDTDIIAMAQTGTGKTAAFGLPLCHHIKAEGIVKALVLAPTRELAVQVCAARPVLRQALVHHSARFTQVPTAALIQAQGFSLIGTMPC